MSSHIDKQLEAAREHRQALRAKLDKALIAVEKIAEEIAEVDREIDIYNSPWWG